MLFSYAWTGARRGELLALRWPQVDLASRQLRIERQRISINWKVSEGPPKTKAGNRWVPFLNDHLGTVLGEWGERQKSGQVVPMTTHVFTDAFGQPLHPERVGKEFSAQW